MRLRHTRNNKGSSEHATAVWVRAMHQKIHRPMKEHPGHEQHGHKHEHEQHTHKQSQQWQKHLSFPWFCQQQRMEGWKKSWVLWKGFRIWRKTPKSPKRCEWGWHVSATHVASMCTGQGPLWDSHVGLKKQIWPIFKAETRHAPKSFEWQQHTKQLRCLQLAGAYF